MMFSTSGHLHLLVPHLTFAQSLLPQLKYLLKKELFNSVIFLHVSSHTFKLLRRKTWHEQFKKKGWFPWF